MQVTTGLRQVTLTEIQMLSAMAQCRMQIEKCKIAFCQIGTLARLHVNTFAR